MPSTRRISSTALLLTASLIALNWHAAALAGTISNLSPSSLTVCAAGIAQQFSYGESDPNATVTATSASTSIATVTPSSMKGSGHFNVHGQAAGTTTIALSDGAGGLASEPVTVNGPITVTPASRTLTFNGSSVAGTQPVTISVSDPGPPTTVTATISSSIALFSNGQTSVQAATSGGTAQFTIDPVGSTTAAQANATISFTDTSTCTSSSQNTIAVSVIPGSLAITSPAPPAALSFAGPNDAAQQVTLTDYDFAGTLTAALGTCNPGCASVATVTGPAIAPGGASTAAFKVQPAGVGNAILSLTGSTTQTVKVLVNGASLSAVGGSPVQFNTSGGNGISGAGSSDLTSTAIAVTGALQTSGGGSGSVYISTPGDITAGGGTLPISALQYECSQTGTGITNNGAIALAANSVSDPCLQFNAGQYFALSFNLNFILNHNAANALPAGTYSSPAGFTLYISAT